MTKQTETRLKKTKAARVKQRERLADIQGKIAKLDVEIAAAHEGLPDVEDVDVAVETITKLELERQALEQFAQPVNNRISDLDDSIADLEHVLALATVEAGLAKAEALAGECSSTVSVVDYVLGIKQVIQDIDGPIGVLSRSRNVNGKEEAFYRAKGIRRQLSKRAGELERANWLIQEAGRALGARQS